MVPRPEEEQAENGRIVSGDGLLTTNLEEPLLPPQSALSNHELSQPQSQIPTTNDNEDEEDRKNVVIRLCGRRYLSMNHNVFYNIVLCVLFGLSDSLWNGTVMVAYLKRLGHEENSPVGYIEAINGLAVLFSALPVGYVADIYGRDKMIRAGGILCVVTGVLHAALLTWIGTDEADLSDSQRQMSLILLGAVMGLWGIGGGIVNGPCQALYADSTPSGERSRFYHYLFVAYLISGMMGPIVSIVLFQKLGDNWSLYQLRTIIFVGLGMGTCSAFFMMLFDDSKALNEHGDEHEENDRREEEEERGTGIMNDTVTTTGNEETLAAPQTRDTEDGLPSEALIPPVDAASNSAAAPAKSRRQRMVPFILFGTGLIFAIGSGMTVKFFPLFFKDEVGMSPSQVQFIYVLVPLVMSIFSGVGTWLAQFLGRVETTLVLQGAGVACLYAMVWCKGYLDAHPFVLVPVYVLRTALMNCTYPLLESILMDAVPKHERARWKSLESISSFGWCGSAAIGGYMSDRYDYTHTFFVTATIQLLGTLLQALLLPLVPRFEQEQRQRPQAAITGNNDSRNCSNGCGRGTPQDQPRCNGENETPPRAALKNSAPEQE